MAGMMIRSSSRSPNRPCSPACGLRPQTTIFGSLAAELGQRLGGQFDHVENALFREQRRHFAIADVDGDEGAGDFLGVLHHAGAGSIRAGGEDFGVAGIVDAGGVHRFFVERRGRDGGDLAGEGGVDGAIDVGVAGAASYRADDAGLNAARGERLQIDDAGAVDSGPIRQPCVMRHNRRRQAADSCASATRSQNASVAEQNRRAFAWRSADRRASADRPPARLPAGSPIVMAMRGSGHLALAPSRDGVPMRGTRQPDRVAPP